MSRILYQLLPLMKEILKKSDLLSDSGNSPSLKIKIWNDLNDYKNVWEHHYQNRSYHILLIDLSFFRFNYIDDKIHFEFLHCPYNFREDSIENENPEEILPTPIRYDYNPQEFNPISHPVGHLHIGLNNSIRIGTCCVFNPLSFLLFCLRQMYPNYWKNVLKNTSFNTCQKHIRENVLKIENIYREAFDREHFIS